MLAYLLVYSCDIHKCPLKRQYLNRCFSLPYIPCYPRYSPPPEFYINYTDSLIFAKKMI